MIGHGSRPASQVQFLLDPPQQAGSVPAVFRDMFIAISEENGF